MIKKVILFILFFYLLVLLQTSFFPHFLNFLPNFILIAIILINYLSPSQSFLEVMIISFFGGFFLDIFSENFFGFWTLITLTTSIFIRLFLKKYISPVIRLKN